MDVVTDVADRRTAVRCPYCRHADSRVVDSREADDGQLIRRRRSCPECGKRFTTVEEAVLAIVKRNGVTEPFSRTKIMSGVRKACQGRPVDEDSIALLAQRVEETIRAKGAAEVPSHDVGLAILGPLRELDQVAYLRFASVYKSVDSLDEFEREIVALREATAARDATTREATAQGTPAGETTAQETTARPSTARDATARESTARDATARESTARDATAREINAREAAAREAAARHVVATRPAGRPPKINEPASGRTQ
jgi:transcriptional repressor NrdR